MDKIGSEMRRQKQKLYQHLSHADLVQRCITLDVALDKANFACRTSAKEEEESWEERATRLCKIGRGRVRKANCALNKLTVRVRETGYGTLQTHLLVSPLSFQGHDLQKYSYIRCKVCREPGGGRERGDRRTQFKDKIKELEETLHRKDRVTALTTKDGFD